MGKRWLGLVFAAIAGAVAVWAYPRLPETVPTHWNFAGQPDGYSSRLWASVLGPIAIVALTGLFQVLPRIDPRGRNYQKFPDTYWMLVNGVLAFALVAHTVLLANGTGAPVNPTRVLTVAGGLLFVLVGNYLGRIESNWFLGIRTPWTLSSDTVWRKTHRTAGWLFVVAGLGVAAVGAVRPVGFVPLLAIAAALVAGVPMVQSYVLWRREKIG
jgi:uncharacterized membrane protein